MHGFCTILNYNYQNKIHSQLIVAGVHVFTWIHTTWLVRTRSHFLLVNKSSYYGWITQRIYVIYFSICNGATQITVARWLTGQLLFNYYKTSVYGHHRVYDTEARVVITFVHTIIKGAKVGICLFLNEYRKAKTSKV